MRHYRNLEKMRGSMRRLIGVLAAVLIVGCDGGPTEESTIVGPYTLRTINGSPLPYTINGPETSKTEILDDVIYLFEGFTYSEDGHSRVTVNGQTTNTVIHETGSYIILGTSVTLSSSDKSHQRITTIEGTTLRHTEAGVAAVYRK